MSRVSRVDRVELNKPAVIALLKSEAVAQDLRRRAEAVKDNLPTDNGEEWAVSSFLGYDRAQATVRTANFAARKTAAEEPVMIRALDHGR